MAAGFRVCFLLSQEIFNMWNNLTEPLYETQRKNELNQNIAYKIFHTSPYLIQKPPRFVVCGRPGFINESSEFPQRSLHTPWPQFCIN